MTQLLSRVAFGASSSKEGDGKDSSSERARRKLISARRSSPLLALIAFQAASPEKVSETDSLNALQRVFKIRETNASTKAREWECLDTSAFRVKAAFACVQ